MHDVSRRYRPRSLAIGALGSLVSLVALLLAARRGWLDLDGRNGQATELAPTVQTS